MTIYGVRNTAVFYSLIGDAQYDSRPALFDLEAILTSDTVGVVADRVPSDRVCR